MTDQNESSLVSLTTRRTLMLGAAAVFGSAAVVPGSVRADDESGVSHSAEAIHQEPVFAVARQRVFEALTKAEQFEQIVQLSAAKRSGALGSEPAKISAEVGGMFKLFGGYISGRHLELLPGERIVQAWRTGSWKPGEYSIVRFELREHGPGTKIIFDHLGFPQGQAEHLASGWKGNYWEPLQKYLEQKK
jgi:uncharacterized protein YndB with AHSA1/START domain